MGNKGWWLEEEEAESAAASPRPGKRGKLKRWQWVVLTGLFLFIGGIAWAWSIIDDGLPTVEQLENPRPELATKIISADGENIDQYFIKNRTTVRLQDVPPDMINALLATEDREFYDHWGIHISRLAKAIWKDVVTLSPKEGASTITQQLARNLYLSQEKTGMRKIREMISAVKIEKRYTKHEILEMYLNTVYEGRGAYGVQVASQLYFGKDVKDLSTAECAYLVGILKGPENYDPEENYDRAMQRRNLVLQNMVEAGYMQAEQASKLKQTPIKTIPMKGYQGIAPHFVEMVRQDLSKKPEMQGYDLYRDGLVIYTTLNSTLQRAANRAVTEHNGYYQKNVVDKRWNWAAHRGLLDTIIAKAVRSNSAWKQADPEDRAAVEKRLRGDTHFIDSVKAAEIRLQTGFVAIDHTTGQILALVGSSNYQEARYGLNHVTQIQRQPGSSFKPIIYAAAFERGATPETMVSNEPVNIPDGNRVWSPRNFEGEATGGSVSIRTALQYSINLASIHAMLELSSIQDVIRMAKRLGIKANIGPYPSIALGVSEVTPLELTSAYGTFANEGIRAQPYAILRVEDRNGKVLYRAKPEFENVMEPRIARMMTNCLTAVVDHGTAVRVRSEFHYPAAGKTGTTQNYADAWFVGYTPHFTAGVWVGFDDKRVAFTGADGQGGRAAAPIWAKFMKAAYEELKPQVTYFQTNYSASGMDMPRRSTSYDSSIGRDIQTVPNRGIQPTEPSPDPLKTLPKSKEEAEALKEAQKEGLKNGGLNQQDQRPIGESSPVPAGPSVHRHRSEVPDVSLGDLPEVEVKRNGKPAKPKKIGEATIDQWPPPNQQPVPDRADDKKEQ